MFICLFFVLVFAFVCFVCFIVFCIFVFFHLTQFSPGLSKFFNLCLCCMLAGRTHGLKSKSLNKGPSLFTQSMENQSTAWVPGKEIVEIKLLERKAKINLNDVIFTTTVCFVVLLRFHLVHLCGSMDHVSQTMWCTCRCIWLKPTIKSNKNCILDLEEFCFLVSSTITNLFTCT